MDVHAWKEGKKTNDVRMTNVFVCVIVCLQVTMGCRGWWWSLSAVLADEAKVGDRRQSEMSMRVCVCVCVCTHTCVCLGAVAVKAQLITYFGKF